jgi:hypothetical protein
LFFSAVTKEGEGQRFMLRYGQVECLSRTSKPGHVTDDNTDFRKAGISKSKRAIFSANLKISLVRSKMVRTHIQIILWPVTQITAIAIHMEYSFWQNLSRKKIADKQPA